MRLTGLVLCMLAVPALAGPIQIGNPGSGVFDVVSGSLTIDTSPDGLANPDPATVLLGGTFAADIWANDGHIGESDTFLLGAADISNTEEVVLSLVNIATATIPVGNAKFTAFIDPAGPGHVPNSIYETDAILEATIFVTGALETTFETTTSAGMLLPFEVTVSESAAGLSDTVTMSIAGTFGYEIGISDISATLTLDLVIEVVGTAHVIPDPALGGLTALGVGGAGAWLRRRRS